MVEHDLKESLMTSLEQRFAELEAVVASQRTSLADQRAELDALSKWVPSAAADPRSAHGAQEDHADRTESRSSDEAVSSSTSRRRLLTGGAVAAGAAIVGATVAPQTAAATDGFSLVVGANNTSAGGNTRLNGTGAGQYVSQNILTVSDQSSSSAYPSAIGAYGQSDRVGNGLYAYNSGRDINNSRTGYALVAASASGRANVLLVPSGVSPAADTVAHRGGALRADSSGNLWFCVDAGTPGTWRKLAGRESAGAVHALAPSRVYDSRFADGSLGSGFNRAVSVTTSIDVTTGAPVLADVVPPGATSVFFNLTITETTGSGFVLIAPGNATEVTGSTMNWSAAGQTLANGSLTTVDATRTVRAFVGGGGSTHFIIDITGYTL